MVVSKTERGEYQYDKDGPRYWEWHHLCHVLLIKAVTESAHIQREGMETPFSTVGMSEIAATAFGEPVSPGGRKRIPAISVNKGMTVGPCVAEQ